MIGTIDVEINAAHPAMPLAEFAAFVNSPSHVRVRNVPRGVGAWSITAVHVVVSYPDNSIRSTACAHVGALWTCTIPACALDGKVENGFQVIADGVDENGNAITGYVLGLGDVCVLKRDGTVTVGKTSYYYHFLDEVPEHPQVADVCVIGGQLKWYDGEDWIAFGGADMSHADFAGLPAADLVPEEVGIPEICSLLNAVKNLLRPSALLLMCALCAALSISAATVETSKLVNLKGASNVVTRVDLSGLASTSDVANLRDGLTDGTIKVTAALTADTAISADNATYASSAGTATFADGAAYTDWSSGLAGQTQGIRGGDAIFAQIDKSTGDITTLGNQVSSIGSYLNAEDARFVSTNYDSVTRLPEAYVEVRLNDHGTNKWVEIWREMTRWNKFVGEGFLWDNWGGFYNTWTNMVQEVEHKADRAWGAYDSETGGWSPEGYTQVSSSNILIAAGMAYQRTITSAGAVWVLQCNQGTATIGGDTNGYFRIMDAEGNTQFEIIKGDKREVGADASGITVGSGNVLTIPYSVEAGEHPVIQCTATLDAPSWKAEDDPDCLCTVSWSGSSGAWVATVTPKTAQSSMFVKATYMTGGETYIRNAAPVGMDRLYLNGTLYYLGTATINGHTVLTLSTTAP